MGEVEGRDDDLSRCVGRLRLIQFDDFRGFRTPGREGSSHYFWNVNGVLWARRVVHELEICRVCIYFTVDIVQTEVSRDTCRCFF